MNFTIHDDDDEEKLSCLRCARLKLVK